MPMTYTQIDPAEVEAETSAATGFGNPADVAVNDAIGAEADACTLEIERAIFVAHATSVLPNGADPDAGAWQQKADDGVPVVAEARERADRLAVAVGIDVSGVRQRILDGHRERAEREYAAAEWTASNATGLSQPELDALQLICDRAEREAAVIDGWA